ncbi:MAG: DUF4437 domain-containing protein [Rhodospirillaceae bacterium]|nr:DUF4437 domain-containing protein [Rhodospirillaceae bacterium]
MRPHVELIQQTDLLWHPAELPYGDGKVRQRNLSYCEEFGAATTKLYFESPWVRPAGYHSADTEWFILKGMVRIGDQVLTDGSYWRAPAGLWVPQISVKEGAEILVFREYGDWGFTRSDKPRVGFISKGGNTASADPGTFDIVETAKMKWHEKTDEDFAMTHGTEGWPQGNLRHKWLFRDPAPEGDPTKGFGSLLCWAPPGWSDTRLMHHPVFEEAYTLDGTMEYNFGDLKEGTYFFRPARVKHGHFKAGEEKGTVFLIRVDGQLINWASTDHHVEVHATPINYDPETEGPVIAGLPVRSRSTGHWDRDGW